MSITATAGLEATTSPIDELCVNTIRTLCMDAVQQANSGHPGTPMAMAPVAYTLWQDHLRFDPDDPIWPNRDRFVLSIGHASMLLYSMLHLTRSEGGQSEVRSAGPAYRSRSTTSSASASSTASARAIRNTAGRRASKPPPARWARALPPASAWRSPSKWMAQYFNRPGFEMFDYNVYALCGDGCMMEGVSSEAASLAGHLKLDNLCWIYDNNHITIEGNTSWAFSEDVATRFIGYGWNVTRVGDANDLEMLQRALSTRSRRPTDRPTLIIVDSHIAYGAPNKQDTSAAHGEPLGEEEIKLTKQTTAGRKMRNSWCPTAFTTTSRTRMGKRGKEAARGLDGKVRRIQGHSFPELADQLHQHAASRAARGLGQGHSRLSQPTPRAWPDAMPRARC